MKIVAFSPISYLREGLKDVRPAMLASDKIRRPKLLFRPELSGKTLFVNSGGVSDIRLAQTQSDTVRMVLDLEKRFDSSVAAVPN